MSLRRERPVQDASWADHIQRYEREKHAVPEGNGFVPYRSYRDSRYNQKKDERQYDILRQQYRDGGKEKTLRENERQEAVDMLNKAKDQALKYDTPWDVISHYTKVVGGENRPPTAPRWQPPPTPPPEPEQKPKPVHYEEDSLSAMVEQRDYDIVSNRYVVGDHDKRLKGDIKLARTQAAEKFWKVNHYDPVRGVFYNPEEERKFEEFRASAQKTHGQDKMSKLPPYMRQSEGSAYDITSLRVKDKDLMRIREAQHSNSKQRMKMRYEYEETVHSRDIETQKEDAFRKTNRISHQRYLDTMERGFDILSNKEFHGRGHQEVAPSQTQAKLSLWDQIQAERKQLSKTAQRARRSKPNLANTVGEPVVDRGAPQGSRPPSNQRRRAEEPLPGQEPGFDLPPNRDTYSPASQASSGRRTPASRRSGSRRSSRSSTSSRYSNQSSLSAQSRHSGHGRRAANPASDMPSYLKPIKIDSRPVSQQQGDRSALGMEDNKSPLILMNSKSKSTLKHSLKMKQQFGLPMLAT